METSSDLAICSTVYRAAGAKDNGQPGPRPAYGPTYYAAYIHDTNGNNIEVCYM